MKDNMLYQDIAQRTDGDIYVGVVGPVRTGKSTFIKRFMDLLVIPNIDNEYKRERAQDELPQSAGGRTIMTTEPKFVPNEAVGITVGDNIKLNVRLVDCVGYLVNNAIGYLEDDMPRMVKTPWNTEEIPFEEAAEIGTRKVIKEHSTIGVLVTTDGSVTDIPREDYIGAEERVVKELKELNKPFIIVLNSSEPESDYTRSLAEKLQEKYDAQVVPTDCENLSRDKIDEIFGRVLYEFPIDRVNISFPRWVDGLPEDHWLKEELYDEVEDKKVYTLQEEQPTPIGWHPANEEEAVARIEAIEEEYENGQYIDAEEFEKEQREPFFKIAEPFEKYMQEKGHEVVEALLTGDPAAQISKYAKEHNLSLMVMGTHGGNSLRIMMLGSVTMLVASQTKLPMLLVHHDDPTLLRDLSKEE